MCVLKAMSYTVQLQSQSTLWIWRTKDYGFTSARIDFPLQRHSPTHAKLIWVREHRAA
jgi:hypothetical protein